MDNVEYLERIKDTFGPGPNADAVLFCMVGLAGEAGEIANLAAKAMRGDFVPAALTEDALSLLEGVTETCIGWDRRRKLINEMGGVFWYLHALCWQLGVRPEEVMAANAAKLADRKARGVIKGDGDDR